MYAHFGYNLKATDMQAAIGLAQLDKLPGFTESRRKHFEQLRTKLEPVRDRLLLPEACPGSHPSWFGFPVTCEKGTDRAKVVPYLESKGIQTRMLFAGNLIKQPCFDGIRGVGNGYRVIGDLPNTEQIMRDTFWMGVYPGMSDEMVDYMAEMMVEAVG